MNLGGRRVPNAACEWAVSAAAERGTGRNRRWVRNVNTPVAPVESTRLVNVHTSNSRAGVYSAAANLEKRRWLQTQRFEAWNPRSRVRCSRPSTEGSMPRARCSTPWCAEGLRAAYGAKFERLSLLKLKYDPHNVFRMNENVTPAV